MGTLDTRGEEMALLRSHLHKMGHRTMVMDLGTGGEPAFSPEISASQVAAAAGKKLAHLHQSSDTAGNARTMISGAMIILQDLWIKKEFAGVISIGGASGTTVATAIMQSLPFGVPKVMVSSTAAMPEYAGKYFGTKDLVIFHSVVDIAGLNSLVEDLLLRAAGCISGMVSVSGGSGSLLEGERSSLRIALTEFKFSEPCCQLLRNGLKELGLEVIAYHAQGIGDRAMEEAIEQGLFDGVMDIVPAGLAEELLGGNRAAGKNRLEAAGKAGIPQVLTPCGFEMLSCGPLERREKRDLLWEKRQLARRKLFIPDTYRVQARTTGDELREVARLFARRLNQARGPVEVVVPLQGWSLLSETSAPLCDMEADAVFVAELQQKLQRQVEFTTVDAPLNSPVFAQTALKKLLKYFPVQPDALIPSLTRRQKL